MTGKDHHTIELGECIKAAGPLVQRMAAEAEASELDPMHFCFTTLYAGLLAATYPFVERGQVNREKYRAVLDMLFDIACAQADEIERINRGEEAGG